MKPQTVHLQSFFQMEEMVLLNMMKGMSQLYHSMLQRENPPTYILLHWMMLLLSLIVPHLLIPTIVMNLILNIYAKARKFGNASLVVYKELTNLPVLLDQIKYLLVLPDLTVRSSNANNTIVFQVK